MRTPGRPVHEPHGMVGELGEFLGFGVEEYGLVCFLGDDAGGVVHIGGW